MRQKLTAPALATLLLAIGAGFAGLSAARALARAEADNIDALGLEIVEHAGHAALGLHAVADENDAAVLVLWQHRGRQPRRSELSSPPSAISQTPYSRRFGSWTASLEAFVSYANGAGAEPSAIQPGPETARHTTGRDPSLRLRWHVLQRDRFTCCACGASPALALGVELHVDHIVPWSEWGETVLENLQTLCSVCNLGKSNVHQG